MITKCQYVKVFQLSGRRRVIHLSISIYLFLIVYSLADANNAEDVFYIFIAVSLLSILIYVVLHMVNLMNFRLFELRMSHSLVVKINHGLFYFIELPNRNFNVFYLLISVRSKGLFIRYPFSLFYKHNVFPYED